MIVEVSVRIAVLAACGWLAAACLRRNAAARHAVWTAVLVGMLLMPFLYAIGPRVPVRALPERASATPPIIASVDIESPKINTVATSSSGRGVLGWADIATAIYFIGAAVLGVRLLLALRKRNRLIEAARRIEVHAPGDVELLESADLAVPVIAGWLRPKILFPISWHDWDRGRFDAVLAHEFAHVRRGDTLIAMFAAINRVFFWFHPAAWFVERQLAAAAEEAADDAALLIVSSRDSYAEALLQIASALTGRRPHAAWSGTAMAASKVGARIRRLLDEEYQPPQPASRPRRIAFAAASGITLLLTSLMTVERRVSAQPQGVVMHGTMPDPAMTSELARKFEDQLGQFPKDMPTRARLMNYYHARGESEALLRHISWVVMNAPGDFASWEIVRWSTHPQVRVAATNLWIGAADRHRDDPRVLENAARFFEATGVVVRAEDYAKLTRLLQPKDPIRYTPLAAAPYPVSLKLTWRNDGVSIESNHDPLP